MRLYYSGASNYEEKQLKSILSLGNYISSSEVPSGKIGSTFKSLSKLVKDRGDKQLFMLVLKNTTGLEATNVTIYYDYPDNNKYKLELAFVSPATDSNGNPIFEKISSPSSLPISGTFSEYNTIGNATNIGSISNEGMVGIWFKTTLVSSNNEPLTDQELYDNFIATPQTQLSTEEEITFSISYI